MGIHPPGIPCSRHARMGSIVPRLWPKWGDLGGKRGVKGGLVCGPSRAPLAPKCLKSAPRSGCAKVRAGCACLSLVLAVLQERQTKVVSAGVGKRGVKKGLAWYKSSPCCGDGETVVGVSSLGPPRVTCTPSGAISWVVYKEKAGARKQSAATRVCRGI